MTVVHELLLVTQANPGLRHFSCRSVSNVNQCSKESIAYIRLHTFHHNEAGSGIIEAMDTNLRYLYEYQSAQQLSVEAATLLGEHCACCCVSCMVIGCLG